jgi:hypothetical protein
MKAHTATERAFETAFLLQKELGGALSVTQDEFTKLVIQAMTHFASGDAVSVLIRDEGGQPRLEGGDESGPLGSADGFDRERAERWAMQFDNATFARHDRNDGKLIPTQFRSWIAIPILAKKRCVMLIVLARGRGAFTDDEETAARQLGLYLSQILKNSRGRNRRAERIVDETTHRMLLRTQTDAGLKTAEIPGHARAVDYAAGIGSDLGLVYPNGEDSLLISVCDVTADDVNRQIGLVYIDTWFAILSQTSLDAKGMMRRLNLDMVRRKAECYASVALIRHNRKTGVAEFAGAGTCAILHFRHETMSVKQYRFGPAAGVKSDLDVQGQSVALSPGDIVCAFTDGLPETRKQNGNPFGEDAISELLRKNYFLSPQDLADKIVKSVAESAKDGADGDDKTIHILKIA